MLPLYLAGNRMTWQRIQRGHLSHCFHQEADFPIGHDTFIGQGHLLIP